MHQPRPQRTRAPVCFDIHYNDLKYYIVIQCCFYFFCDLQDFTEYQNFRYFVRQYLKCALSSHTYLATQFGEGGVILHLGADIKDELDVDHFPRYIPTSTFSAFPNEKELFFSGKRCKFKIENIFESGWRGHKTEISALNVLQKLLENGKVHESTLTCDLSVQS